ncbi:corticotropin-releasing factor receptor 2 isoform X4 [Podarcis raffonei]|uniref:corticotropin-releasing factor receptor 2 isoform X4 n=2 Tax=Podarcis raffonei TaxID=65483 RepID=UPI0023294BC8|nr:corticotropin-releasing factor receptor 2 isoform X4 [Podarcis raffonei]
MGRRSAQLRSPRALPAAFFFLLPVPTATPPPIRSGPAGPRPAPGSWWRDLAPSFSTESSTTPREMFTENAWGTGPGPPRPITPSVSRFWLKRSIRCLRNIIHWNLITTFILRNVMWFLLQMIDHDIHENNELWCRCITAIFNYFVVTNFFWMFVEGCYLHTAIVMTYSTDKLRKWVFLFIGWCIPCPIIIAWAVCKLHYENEQCWFGKESGKYIDYIYQGPVILVLLINFVFLFNIVRILMTKLRASTTSETIQYRKAVKATLVLLPLLGITYMLFFVNPGEDDISQIFFIYFNSFLQSFQGFFVSVFYCFLNGEVRSAARKRWHRWQDHHSLRVRVARAMSIPTSPTRISFHSIKQTAAV